MNSKELRIGSLINYEQTTHEVISLQEEYCASTWVEDDDLCNPYIHNYDNIKPIPLTEEWLIKFGLKKVGINYEISDFTVWFNKPKVRYVVRLSNTKSIEVGTVHQLQNLYFALTGEELTHE